MTKQFLLIFLSVQWLLLEVTSPQSNLRRARRSCTTIQHSPHWLQWDAPNSPQNCAFSFDDHHPCNTPIIRPTPPSQTASGSTQPFCHSTLSDRRTHTQTHTHRPIDGLSDMSVRWVLTLAVLIQSDALIMLLEHRYTIACSGVYVDRAYNGNITEIFS